MHAENNDAMHEGQKGAKPRLNRMSRQSGLQRLSIKSTHTDVLVVFLHQRNYLTFPGSFLRSNVSEHVACVMSKPRCIGVAISQSTNHTETTS